MERVAWAEVRSVDIKPWAQMHLCQICKNEAFLIMPRTDCSFFIQLQQF